MPTAEEIARYGNGKGKGKATDRKKGILGRKTLEARLDITAISPELIGEVVCVVVSDGDAIMVGTTSDGGAISLTLFRGGEREKEYYSNTEELEFALRGIYEAYKGL